MSEAELLVKKFGEAFNNNMRLPPKLADEGKLKKVYVDAVAMTNTAADLLVAYRHELPAGQGDGTGGTRQFKNWKTKQKEFTYLQIENVNLINIF